MAYVDGSLSATRRDDLEHHLESCVPCRQLLIHLAQDRLASEVGGDSEAVASASDVRSQPSWTPPHLIDLQGRYHIRSELGRGGMGIVFHGWDHRLARDVAIKVLHPRLLSADRDAPDRLLAESKAMARLRHPNVVAVHDIVVEPHRAFVVMELVQGTNLRLWLATHKPSWRQILTLFEEIGLGLAAAHRAGVIHRDFKPDNVLIDRDGRPQITDFGLARTFDPDPTTLLGDAAAEAATPLNLQSSTIGGTPAYMAPEQFRRGAVDARTDVFAFCVAVWEALYGERPFGEQSLQDRIDSAQAGPLPFLRRRRSSPQRVQRVLRRGLAADPEQRYPTIDALMDALRRAARPRTQRWAAGLAAVGVAGAAAALVVGSNSAPKVGPCLALADPPVNPWTPEVAQAIETTLLKHQPTRAPLAAMEVGKDAVDLWKNGIDARQKLCSLERSAEANPTRVLHELECIESVDWELERLLKMAKEGYFAPLAALDFVFPPELCEATARQAVADGQSLTVDNHLTSAPVRRHITELVLTLYIDARLAADDAATAGKRAIAMGRPDLAARAAMVRGAALAASVGPKHGLPVLQRAARLAEQSGDRYLEAWIRLILPATHGAPRTNQFYRDCFDRIAALQQELLDERLRGRIAAELGVLRGQHLLALGDAEQLSTQLKQLRTLTAQHRPELVSHVLQLAAGLAELNGDPHGTLTQLDELVTWNLTRNGIGDPYSIQTALLEAATIQRSLGDFDLAFATLDRLDSILDSYGLAGMASERRLLARSWVHVSQGRTMAARELLAEHRSSEDWSDDSRPRARHLDARILATEGQLDQAIVRLEALVHDVRASADGDIEAVFPYLLSLAQTLERAGSFQAAIDTLAPAVGPTSTAGLRNASDRASTWGTLGWARLGLGEHDNALKLLTDAHDASPYPFERAWLEFGRVVALAYRDSVSPALVDRAVAAQQVLATHPGANRYELEQIGAWLHKHRTPSPP